MVDWKRYKDESDLSLEVTENNQRFYRIIKNRDGATGLLHSATHISKEMFQGMIASDKLKMALFTESGRVITSNFTIGD